MKAFKRLAFTAGIGTSIAVIGSLAFAGFAYADDATTTNQEVTSSESTQAPEDQPTKPTTDLADTPGKDPTESPAATTDTPTQVTSDAPGQPTVGPGNSSNTESNGSLSPTPRAGGEAPAVVTSGPDSSEPPATPETVEVYWALPNGGTADNVTWPQTLANAGNLQCGVWYQVDTYLSTEASGFTSDGVLNQGEDYQNDSQRGAIQWRFVYGGDCPVIPPKPDDDVDTSRDVAYDCASGFVTRTLTEQHFTWTLAPENVWVKAYTEPPQITKTVRPIDPKEHTCPVTTPTTTGQPTTPLPVTTTTAAPSSPKTISSISDSPGTTPNTVSSPPTERLAQTGTNDGMIVALAALLILAGFAFAVASTVSRGKK